MLALLGSEKGNSVRASLCRVIKGHGRGRDEREEEGVGHWRERKEHGGGNERCPPCRLDNRYPGDSAEATPTALVDLINSRWHENGVRVSALVSIQFHQRPCCEGLRQFRQALPRSGQSEWT